MSIHELRKSAFAACHCQILVAHAKIVVDIQDLAVLLHGLCQFPQAVLLKCYDSL